MIQLSKGVTIAGMAFLAAMAGAQINVEVNGKQVAFDNTGPQYREGRVLVPLRGVFENMGASVFWNPNTKTVSANKGSTDVKLQIGDRTATVNGRNMTMDVPAMIIDGSTMVPIRFVSESLGAEVAWNNPTQTVSITTEVANNIPPSTVHPGRIPPNNGQNGRPIIFPGLRKFQVPAGTVIPIVLDTRISSETSRRGDRVYGHIEDFNNGPIRNDPHDFDFPRGSRIEGQITSAIHREGNRPGLLELRFNRIILPNNQSFPIMGSLISLDNRYVIRNRYGMYEAQGSARDNRMVYAGYGAAAGLLVGLTNKKPLESLAAGGILGYLVGSIDRPQRIPRDFTIPVGTRMGVRLDRSVYVMLPRRQ
jgi:hypothetical protein